MGANFEEQKLGVSETSLTWDPKSAALDKLSKHCLETLSRLFKVLH